MKRSFLVVFLMILIGIITGCGQRLTENSQLSILETKEEIGTEGGLYYIPNEYVESGFTQNITRFQGDFLVYGNSGEEEEFCLGLISSQTGAVVTETMLADVEFPNIQICGDILAVTDWSSGEILLLDNKLQKVSEYQVLCEYNSLYLSSDAEKAYVFMPDNGLQITKLSSGDVEVKLEDTANLFVSNKCGNNLTFSYTDRKTQFDQNCMLDLETGNIIECPFEGSFYDIHYVNEVWMASQADSMNTRYLGVDGDVGIVKNSNDFGIMTMHPETGNLIAVLYEETGLSEMTIYDSAGKFLSRCEIDEEGYSVQGGFIWSEADNGYFFIMMDPSARDLLMFWDMSTETSGTDLVFEKLTVERLSENAVSKELYERAKKIGDRYRLKIRIAEQMEEDYSDYKVEENLNEYQIALALDAVERALSKYPEDFFEQLLYGSVRKIEIHLSGSVTNLELPEGKINGFTSYVGFEQEQDDKAIIVVDIGQEGNLEEHFHHEIFHLIDDKLDFDAKIRLDAIYSEEKWMSLNPEGFEYAYSTFELPEYIFNEDYDVWFIEEYSKTFPREDRATIMEYAMLGEEAMFVEAPHRQEKLEYLCECIRDAFDTTEWQDVTVWEDTLKRSY